MTKFILILFILIRIFSNPIANSFQKKLADSISSITINFYTYLFLSIGCLLNINKLIEYNYNKEFITLVFIAGFLCTIGMICMIKAVNIGELSVIGPINSYKSVISLIIAFFLLGEIPTFYGIIGIILIIIGSRYIFLEDGSKFSLNILNRKDIQLRFLAMTLTGVEAVILKKIILISSVEICYSFWCFMGLFWSVILLILSKKQYFIKNIKNLFLILIISICLGLMQYSTNYVFEKMHVGLALAIFQLSSIVTIIFGYKFFHESNLKTKLIGCIIMIIGSCFIIFN